MDERSGGRLEAAVAAIARPRCADDWGYRVCVACRDVLAEIDSVALALHSAGAIVEVIGCSDSVAEQIEDVQMVLGEGPGFTAFGTGDTVRASAGTRDFERWPMYANEVARLGLCAVVALPLRVGGIRIGALDLYRCESGDVPTRAEIDATLLADLISYTLLEGLVAPEPEAVPVATTHPDVNVATGMVAARMGIPLDEAFLRLRAFAFATNSSLLDVARSVLERRVDLDGASE
ncbi:GAF and ANTAR domain-containing protein [Nocardia nova]|uniref:GAF and ANTAR domain-containing protein n=1 Tax=Nocardia nova TaxID=37330 RepID=UPI0037202070